MEPKRAGSIHSVLSLVVPPVIGRTGPTATFHFVSSHLSPKTKYFFECSAAGDLKRLNIRDSPPTP
jgi:hypothetical protein